MPFLLLTVDISILHHIIWHHKSIYLKQKNIEGTQGATKCYKSATQIDRPPTSEQLASQAKAKKESETKLQQ